MHEPLAVQVDNAATPRPVTVREKSEERTHTDTACSFSQRAPLYDSHDAAPCRNLCA